MRLGWDPSFENEEDTYRRPYDGDDRIACLEAAGRVDALLEFADRCLLGQMVEDGDPPDGMVVVVRLGVAVYA